MGLGIACLAAGAGNSVLLLDLADPESSDKSSVAKKALSKALSQKPPPLLHEKDLNLIRPGNLEVDLTLISDCDWVIEAIVEKPEAKGSLYEKILPYLKESAILSSNTSTLSLKGLKEFLPEKIKSRFLVTHFFNPPRYMDLLEIVKDSGTSSAILEKITSFADFSLGKKVIICKDRPGFIANRLGCFLLELSVRRALETGISPPLADAIFSKFLYFPSTGIFGLYDLIGHDVMKLISDSLVRNLPEGDLYREIYFPNPILDKIREKGYIGNKAGGGFYRIEKKDGGKKLSVLNFKDFSYKEIDVSPLGKFSSLEGLFSSGSREGKFLSEILTLFYTYLKDIIEDIAEEPGDVDSAMELGYAWKYGPLSLLRKLSSDSEYFRKKNESAIAALSPYGTAPSGTLISGKTLKENTSAYLSTREGELVFSVRTKMNSLNPEIFDLLTESIEYAESRGKALVIDNAGTNFSAGADLKFIGSLKEKKDFKSIEDFLIKGQKTTYLMKYSPIPVVSLARGFALGGGTELLLHSDFIVAYRELYAGLVEVSAGLVPGWGGIKESFLSSRGEKNLLTKNLSNIIYSKRSTSARYFEELYPVKGFKISPNKYLFSEYKKLNLPKKTIPAKKSLSMESFDLAEEIPPDSLNPFQKKVLGYLQKIIDRKNLSEEILLEYEREFFLESLR